MLYEKTPILLARAVPQPIPYHSDQLCGGVLDDKGIGAGGGGGGSNDDDSRTCAVAPTTTTACPTA